MTFTQLSLTLFASLLLSGCLKVVIPDTEWCGDMGQDGAYCVHTLNDTTRQVPKAAWDQERFGMLCTTSDTFASWKAALEKLCRDSRCSFETKKEMASFFEKAERLAKRTR